MDREIKFRGKNALSGHWVYGFLIKKKNRKNGKIYFAIAVDDCSLANTIPVHAETVGEFTGLKDVDGVDVYEGDIVELNFDDGKRRRFISYAQPTEGFTYPAFDLEPFDLFINPLSDDLIKSLDIIVIGNIHDNPELLEADKNE